MRVLGQCTVAALPSLFLIFLVIGGILAGIFTATEAGDFEVESHVTNAVLVVIRVS